MPNDSTPIVLYALVALALVLLAALLAGLVPRGGLRFRTSPTREQGLLLTVLPISFVLVGVLGKNLPFALFMGTCLVIFALQAFGPKRWHQGRVWGSGPFPLKLKSWETINDKTTLTLSLGYRLVVVARPDNQVFLDALGAKVAATRNSV